MLIIASTTGVQTVVMNGDSIANTSGSYSSEKFVHNLLQFHIFWDRRF